MVSVNVSVVIRIRAESFVPDSNCLLQHLYQSRIRAARADRRRSPINDILVQVDGFVVIGVAIVVRRWECGRW